MNLTGLALYIFYMSPVDVALKQRGAGREAISKEGNLEAMGNVRYLISFIMTMKMIIRVIISVFKI